eukprot:TRINITY_DN152_c0_g1_i1.p1 TRINITY_DN152_c0_g1~~TRINITY_DN152_c0_g1_i1.p1  ORF type:complete len:1284 (-),score=344.97 TRINITY_DN152_c0_g1_i1:38-3889(-)
MATFLGRSASLGVAVLLFVQLVACACPNTTGFTRFANVPSYNVVRGNITIPSGTKILIDQSTPLLYSLTINGTVVIANANIQINTTYIKVNNGGSLIAGSADCMITNKVVFTFFGPKQADGEIGRDDDNTLMGSKGLAVLNGGSINLFGWKSGPSWTRLSATAMANATYIDLEQQVQWKVDSKIVIASTDFSEVYSHTVYAQYGPYDQVRGIGMPDQSEMRTIVNITGKRIYLDQPLKYMHWGEGIERAEVGLLTRQIVLQGEEASNSSRFGGHFMMRRGPSIKLSGIEVTRMGQGGVLARYPIHFHNARYVTDMDYTLEDASIHHNYQRCVVIHETHGVILRNNVAFDTYGHCYFLEDGGERANVMDSNLGITARPVPLEKNATLPNYQLLPTDMTPSIFWITNPNNTFTKNVAVGGTFGFWFVLPTVPLALSGTYYLANDTEVRPRITPLGGFEDNVAHGCFDTCLEIDTMLLANNSVASGSYTPRKGPYVGTNSGAWGRVDGHFKRFTAYKCREFGVWGQSNLHFSEFKLLDNGQAFMVNGHTLLEDSLIVGETANIGTPLAGTNRTRPNRWNTLDLLVGHSSYDNGGPQFSRNNTFVNFTSIAGRPAAAYACLRNGPFVHPPKNQLMQLKYENANQIFVRYGTGDNEWGFLVLDVDGTTTGVPAGAWIIANNTHTLRPDCTYRPEWQANVCPIGEQTYVKMRFEDPNGALTVMYKGVDQKDATLKNKIFRSSWHQLGTNIQDGSFMSGNRLSSGVWVNGLTVTTKRGYAIRLIYTNSTDLYKSNSSKWVDTPPVFQVGVEAMGSGDWVVAAVPYPAGTTFTVTSLNSPYPNYTRVYSFAELEPNTYFFDPVSEHLFVLLLDRNRGTSFEFWWNISSFGASNGVKITASCDPCSPNAAKLAVIPAMPNVTIPRPETYQADLESCQVIGNKESTTAQGKAFFEFYKKLYADEAQLVYTIYHNAHGARRIRLMEGTAGVEGAVVATRNITGVTSATKGIFTLTRNQWESLARGRFYISVEGETPSTRFLRGQVLCKHSEACSLPHAATPALCSPTYETLPIYRDAMTNLTTLVLPTNITGWLNHTGDKVCGSNAIKINYFDRAQISFSFGKWIIDLSKWKSLEFYVRMGAGSGEFAIRIQTGGINGTKWVNWGAYPLKREWIQNFAVDESGWTLVRIPLTAIGFNAALNRTSLNTFDFYPVNYPATARVLFFDEIRFSTEESSLFDVPNTNQAVMYYNPVCKTQEPGHTDSEEDDEASEMSASSALSVGLFSLVVSALAAVF